jgi:arginine N-succinyltransferase
VARNENRVVHETASAVQGPAYLVASNSEGGFRCVLADLSADRTTGAALPAAVREALGVRDGDTVRCVPLHQAAQNEYSGEAQ